MRQGATADVLHVNFTDHWIRKEIEILTDRESEEIFGEEALDKIYTIPITLKNFNNQDDEFTQINLGIAYVLFYESKHPHFEYIKRAIPLLEENLKIYPGHRNGLYYLGIAYLRDNKITDAINIFNKLISIDPGNASAYFQLGFAYEKARNNLQAIESYRRSLDIFPENIKALHDLGNIYSEAGRTNNAIDAYMKAINLVSNNPGILNNLGDLYLYKLQNVEAGMNFLNQALGLDPDLLPALNNLGNAFMISGNTKEAEAIFKQVLQKDQKNVLAYGNLAVIFEERGDIASAIRMLNRVLEIDPNDIRARQMLEKLK